MEFEGQSTKHCKKCGLPKHIDEFGISKKGDKSYRRNICKSCTNRTGNSRTKKLKENVNFANTNMTTYTPKSTSETPKPTIEQNKLPFTEKEIRIIKEIVDQYMNQPTLKELFDEVINNKEKDRTNKTYSIDNVLLPQIIDYCVEHRVNKSNFVNICIRYFLKNSKSKKIV